MNNLWVARTMHDSESNVKFTGCVASYAQRSKNIAGWFALPTYCVFSLFSLKQCIIKQLLDSFLVKSRMTIKVTISSIVAFSLIHLPLTKLLSNSLFLDNLLPDILLSNNSMTVTVKAVV